MATVLKNPKLIVLNGDTPAFNVCLPTVTIGLSVSYISRSKSGHGVVSNLQSRGATKSTHPPTTFQQAWFISYVWRSVDADPQKLKLGRSYLGAEDNKLCPPIKGACLETRWTAYRKPEGPRRLRGVRPCIRCALKRMLLRISLETLNDR